MSEMKNSQSGHEDAFREVLAHRSMLRAYIYALVRDHTLTEDILSDVGIEVARSWNKYDKSRPFPPWGRGIARRVALTWLRRQGKQGILLDESTLESLGTEFDEMGGEDLLEKRKSVLADCIDKLPERSRSLIKLKYFENKTNSEIAGLLKRKLNALYVAMHRVHMMLVDCVNKGLNT